MPCNCPLIDLFMVKRLVFTVARAVFDTTYRIPWIAQAKVITKVLSDVIREIGKVIKKRVLVYYMYHIQRRKKIKYKQICYALLWRNYAIKMQTYYIKKCLILSNYNRTLVAENKSNVCILTRVLTSHIYLILWDIIICVLKYFTENCKLCSEKC